MTPKQYRLNSTEVIHVPGFVAYARNMVTQNGEPEKAREWLSAAFPTLPETAIDNLLSGEYTTRGDSITVTNYNVTEMTFNEAAALGLEAEWNARMRH